MDKPLIKHKNCLPTAKRTDDKLIIFGLKIFMFLLLHFSKVGFIIKSKIMDG